MDSYKIFLILILMNIANVFCYNKKQHDGPRFTLMNRVYPMPFSEKLVSSLSRGIGSSFTAGSSATLPFPEGLMTVSQSSKSLGTGSPFAAGSSATLPLGGTLTDTERLVQPFVGGDTPYCAYCRQRGWRSCIQRWCNSRSRASVGPTSPSVQSGAAFGSVSQSTQGFGRQSQSTPYTGMSTQQQQQFNFQKQQFPRQIQQFGIISQYNGIRYGRKKAHSDC